MVSHNMTWMRYPSQSRDPFTRFEDIIASQHIISRFMHGYVALFAPTGLLAAIIISAVFIKKHKQSALDKLDILLLAHTVSSGIMILFSLTVITRPAYLKVSYLECGTLSFFFNWNYFSSQYLLILMVLSFVLKRHPPQNALISKAHQNPMISVGFALMCAFCAALIIVALLGIESYHEGTDCQLDPLFAWPEYEIIKFTFGFASPSLSHLLCSILLFVKAAQPESRHSRQNIHPYLTVLVIMITTLACNLFYNVMLLCRASLKIHGSIGTPQNELMMNIAEILLFSKSCVILVIILCLHEPCRTGFITSLIKVCRRRPASNRALEMPETHTEVSCVPSENGSR